MNSDDILRVIEKQKDQLSAYGIARIGLFGSQARRDASTESDIDVLFDFVPKQKTYRNFYNAAAFLENILGQEVDAVTLQGLSPHIKPHIEKDIRYVQISR